MVTGIGVRRGVECVITANDPTVKGGAQSPTTRAQGPARHGDRAQQPAAADQPDRVRRRRPAQPGRDLRPRRRELPRTSRSCSAAGIPTIRLVFGSSTAGGAYVPGMSDYVVMAEGAAQGLPRRPAAGEDGDRRGRRRGGRSAAPRCTPASRGVVRLPRRRTSATRCASAARSSAHLNWRKLGPARRGSPSSAPRYDPDELLGIASRRRPRAVRRARGASRASSTARGSRSSSRSTAPRSSPAGRTSHGYPVGILANNGILFSEESREGRAVHPALQPARHADPVPAEHHRLHGRHAATSRAASSRTAPSSSTRCRTRPSRTSR